MTWAPPVNGHGSMSGRVALVSGAGSGIGAAITRRFLASGARVHGIGRHLGRLQATAPDELKTGSYLPHVVDVTDRAAVNALADELRRHDPIDVLICCAGTNLTRRRFHQLTEDNFTQLLQTNLTGVFRLIHGTLDQIRAREGDVVVVSSISAAWPSHSGAAYGATKSALLGLTRGLSRDEHANGVRVCTILPGMVDTPILDQRPSPPPADVRALCLQPEDVADAALCAVSLPRRANIAEISIVPTRLQSLGFTQQATPDIPGTALSARMPASSTKAATLS